MTIDSQYTNFYFLSSIDGTMSLLSPYDSLCNLLYSIDSLYSIDFFCSVDGAMLKKKH